MIGYFPPSPMETPSNRTVRLNGRPNRFSDEYDESMEETLKAVRGNQMRQGQDVFQEMRQQAEGLTASRPRPHSIAMGQQFPNGLTLTHDWMSMGNLSDEFCKIEQTVDASHVQGIPMNGGNRAAFLSHHSS